MFRGFRGVGFMGGDCKDFQKQAASRLQVVGFMLRLSPRKSPISSSMQCKGVSEFSDHPHVA